MLDRKFKTALQLCLSVVEQRHSQYGKAVGEVGKLAAMEWIPLDVRAHLRAKRSSGVAEHGGIRSAACEPESFV